MEVRCDQIPFIDDQFLWKPAVQQVNGLLKSESELPSRCRPAWPLIQIINAIGLKGPLGGTVHRGFWIRFRESTKAYALPLELAGSLPVVRWKLIETYRRRYLDVY